MKLHKLLSGVNVTATTGPLDVNITGIVSDHRDAKPGNAFVCYQGLNVDGHTFIASAVERGATVVIGEKLLPVGTTAQPITYLQTPNGRCALSLLAANWHGNPAKRLKLIGITGTNGKTSTAHLIDAILKASGKKTALMGTVGHHYGNAQGEQDSVPSSLTTPDAFALHALFKRFAEAGVEYVTMETSSQGLAQHRLAGLTFDTAVFTNLTQDHLDYHRTMEEYLNAKLMLFQQLGEEGVAILNSDSPVTARIAQVASQHAKSILMYGLDVADVADVADRPPVSALHAQDIELSRNRLAFTAVTPQGRIHAKLRLLGEYNLYNALAAIGVGIRYNCDIPAIEEGLEGTVVPGRFELVDGGQDFAVIVDYAHTPDGLENVLTAAKRITERALICVFGCGGDRDMGKRPKMGNISAQLADYSVITSDNPRTESPGEIISQIVSNLPHDTKHVCIPQRREAIQHAVAMAKPGDVVVIAGKGHEDYQEIHGERFPFDDRVVAADCFFNIPCGELRMQDRSDNAL